MNRTAARVGGSVPPYPALLTAAWLLEAFGAGGEPIGYLWRPFLLVMGAILVVLLATRFAARRHVHAAVFAVSVIWFLFLLAWEILLPLLVIAGWRLGVDWLRRREGVERIAKGRLEQVTQLANVYAFLFLALTTAGVLLTFDFGLAPRGSTGPVDPRAPNVYLLMLDGHPRADTLAGLGIGDGSFVEALESRGFDVAGHSRSNYNATMLSLPALFNGAYLAPNEGPIPPLADREAWELRRRETELQEGRMLDAFRERGYLVATVPSAFGFPALASADIVLDHPYLTKFESGLLERTFALHVVDAFAPDWVASQWAAAVDNAFAQAQEFAHGQRERPALLFAHVLSPHPPLLFASDGSLPDTSDCHFRACGWGSKLTQMGLPLERFVPLLAGQIAYIDRRAIETVDTITAEDPDAVILVLSDHGGRYAAEITDEYFHTFFAARTLGHEGLYPDDASLTNTLPTLLNAYFDASYPVLPYRAWESDDNALTGLRERSDVAP